MKLRSIILVSIACVSGCIGIAQEDDSRSRDNPFAALLVAAGAVKQTSATVTNSGAQMQSADVSLTIPPDALDEPTEITISTSDTPVPDQDGIRQIAKAIVLEPEGTTFNLPITIKACYALPEGVVEDGIRLYYMDPDTGEYASIGGDVDKNSHCLTAQTDHFSTYFIGDAQGDLLLGNIPPTVGGANFTPNRPAISIPLVIRSNIFDTKVPGSVDEPNIASVTLFYRITGTTAVRQVAMAPDPLDPTGEFYIYKIPEADVTAAGIQYRIVATDNLGATTCRPVSASCNTWANRSVPYTYTGTSRLTPAVARMTAGFSRDLGMQLQVQSGVAAPVWTTNVRIESASIQGPTAAGPNPVQITSTLWRYRPTEKGNSHFDATYGTASVGLGYPITVQAGTLVGLELWINGSQYPWPVFDGLNAGDILYPDIRAVDAYGNQQSVLVTATVNPGAGSPVVVDLSVNPATITAPADNGTYQQSDVVFTYGSLSRTLTVGVNPIYYPYYVQVHNWMSVGLGGSFGLEMILKRVWITMDGNVVVGQGPLNPGASGPVATPAAPMGNHTFSNQTCIKDVFGQDSGNCQCTASMGNPASTTVYIGPGVSPTVHMYCWETAPW